MSVFRPGGLNVYTLCVYVCAVCFMLTLSLCGMAERGHTASSLGGNKKAPRHLSSHPADIYHLAQIAATSRSIFCLTHCSGSVCETEDELTMIEHTAQLRRCNQGAAGKVHPPFDPLKVV